MHDLELLETQKHSLNHYYIELMVEQDKSKKELEETYGKVTPVNEDVTELTWLATETEAPETTEE